MPRCYMIKHQKHKFKSYKSKIKPAITSGPSTLCSSKKSWLQQHMKEQEMARLLNASHSEDDEECLDPSHERCIGISKEAKGKHFSFLHLKNVINTFKMFKGSN